jgi:PPK2 family polyphosphate:nucleotide phosphotransferase
MKLKSLHRVHHHARIKLAKIPTTPASALSEEDADALVKKHREQLESLQEVLYASQSKAVLIVLQGMDTAGKDGTIRHIFSGINPQGCDVSSFRPPTPLESRHDFLWRCQKRLPAFGMIGIFNRSHYEDVLVPRVHGKITEKAARRRMREINDWEKTLAANGTAILKFYLHISREEQTRRLQSRIDTPDKRWKLSPADFAERAFWPKYIDAYEEILHHTSQRPAPWFVIPSDDKSYRNVAISTILVEALRSLKLQYPPPTFNARGLNLSKQDATATSKKVATRAAEAAAS